MVRRAVRGARGGTDECIHFLYLRFAGVVETRISELGPGESPPDRVAKDLFASLSGAIAGYDEAAGEFEAWLLDLATAFAGGEAEGS